MLDRNTGVGWTVLIVDDQMDNVNVARTALEFYGAKVYVAANGREGLALLQTINPTVILLDLSMPVMDGWEMFRQLRSRPELAGVPIIAVTAHAMYDDRCRVLKAGFDEYIPKPYDIDDFVTRIQSVIDRRVKSQAHV